MVCIVSSLSLLKRKFLMKDCIQKWTQSGQVRSGVGAYAGAAHAASTLRRYSFGLRLAIVRPIIPVTFR